MRTKEQQTEAKKFAVKMAKDLVKVQPELNWHERAAECCGYSNEQIAAYSAGPASCEWYYKITLYSEDWVNVKVCYHLAGMYGYNHLDWLTPNYPDSKAVMFTNIVGIVRRLREFAIAAIEAGMITEHRVT